MKPKRVLIFLMLGGFLIVPCWHGNAKAYDPAISSNLMHSKDALLKQREELLDACDRRKSQIDRLQQEIERLQGYVRDTDRTLRDIDIALSRG